tara:strand:+ start:3239 stop:4522 length:1284 start_codon:yes stop_codon:yes gene_type:complete
MSEVKLDIQEISLDDPIPDVNVNKEISLNASSSSDLKESNFGSGIELLMNEKVKNASKSPSSNSLKDLEQELNAFDVGGGETNKEIKYEEKDSFQNKPKIEIAKATSEMETKTETWDGFKDINAVNLDDIGSQAKKMGREEQLKEKFEVLRKLETLETKGATLSKKYSMDSDLNEMKGEYEFLINEKEKENSVKFQGKVLTTMITGLEFLNNKFDPFDIKLDGWSEQINENVDDFDEIFAELHEKYKSKAKMAPEIKLLFQLASSGIMIHMTNTMFKSALPGMDDIMRQNPDLMNHFTKAAMSSMEQSSPGLSNFMNDMGMSHGSGPSGAQQSSQPQSFRPSTASPPQSQPPPPQRSNPSMRSEMRGPNNIDSLLSNLGNNEKNITLDKDSTISIDDLDNLSIGSGKSGGKRSSKRKSDKNIVNIAI